MMLQHRIFSAQYAAYDDRSYPQIDQMRDFVGDSLAGSAPVHVERMRENQPGFVIM